MDVVLLMAVLLMGGCASSDELDPNAPVPTVTAQLNISLPTRIAGVRHATRMTGDIAQVKTQDLSENDVFRGIDDVQLLCFDQYPTVSSRKLGATIDINAAESDDIEVTEKDYSLCQQIDIPVGTSYFGFYASATEELTEEEQEQYSDLHERRMHFGAIETVGLSKSSYHGNEGIRFRPVQICTSKDKLGDSSTGWALLNLLNLLMKDIDPEGNLYLNEAYQRMTQLTTLSSYNVQVMLGFILKLINQEAPDDQGSQLVADITETIINCCAKDENQNPIADIENGVIELKEAYQGFPADIHLPDGAARIIWNQEKGKFEVPDKQEYGNSLEVTSVNDYVYPLSLQYLVFSDLRASDKMVILTEEDGEIVPPESAQYDNWQELIEKGYEGAGNTVKSSTQSVVMVQQVDYAVGRLALKARIDGNHTHIPDANGTMIDVRGTPFTLKGYIVGSQREVGYNFMPEENAQPFAIYDTDLNGGQQALKRHDFTQADYILGLSTSADQSILVALELVNNGEDFQGADGLIVHGATFYLVANLNPKDDETHYQSGSLDRVFIKDRFTNVNITISSLASATYGLPNLEIPRPTLGLSVNLSWEEGLWYDEVEL